MTTIKAPKEFLDSSGEPDHDARLNHYIKAGPDKAAQKAVENKLGMMSNDQYRQLRVLAKHDVFTLGSAILGYDKLTPAFHGHVGSWMMRNRKARFRELLLPRGHYKTTLWTITDSIRIGLPDDLDANIWPECLGPNCRILIGHEVKDSAAGFLVSIAGHFLSNPLLMALFPECIPSPRTQRINKFELELPRQQLWNEPTYGTIGVGGRSQGWHYNYLKLDDLIGDKARDSKSEMETAIEWIDNIQSFFVEFTRDHLDIAGTRWAPKDLYSHIHRQYGQALLKYIRPVEEEAKDANGKGTGVMKLIFPEAFTPESLAIIKKNKVVWTAQYLNDPEAGSREFLAGWKRFFKWTKFPQRLICFKGQSDIVELNEAFDVAQLDICILIDPAMSGLAGITVTGMNAAGKVFILEAIKFSFKPPEFIQVLFLLVLKWKPRTVAIEEVLFSGLYKPWLESEMQIRKIFFSIMMVKIGSKAKEARIRGLANYFNAGSIFFSHDQVDLIEEFDTFGSSGDVDNVHLLDSLSMGPHGVWCKPVPQRMWQQQAQLLQSLMDEKDLATGY